MTVTATEEEKGAKDEQWRETFGKKKMITFVPSRDLPSLSRRFGSSVSVKDLLASLKCIASSLGVAKGQSEYIFVDIGHSNLKLSESFKDETIEEVADQFETQFTHQWLLNVNRLGWLENSCDEDEKLIDSILSESSRLIAILSGQSASGGMKKVYHFPQPFSATVNDDNDAQISITITETAIVEDSLGGRTWNAAPLLANYLLNQLKYASLDQLNVLELGAGTGLTGLTLAEALKKSGRKANVHLTDFNENVLSNLQVNSRFNDFPSIYTTQHAEEALAKSVKVDVFPFDWSEAMKDPNVEINKNLLDSYDCLLCADCVYEPQHAKLLHAVANRFLTKGGNAVKNLSYNSSQNFSGKMFILSPLRANLQMETDALHHFFPYPTTSDLNQSKRILSLCITQQTDYILKSGENFGPPRLRTMYDKVKSGPSSLLQADLLDSSNNSHIDTNAGTMYRLYRIEWCNTIE